jgi:hypothetical protein
MIGVIPSADFMILRLTTLHENARSALERGSSSYRLFFSGSCAHVVLA